MPNVKPFVPLLALYLTVLSCNNAKVDTKTSDSSYFAVADTGVQVGGVQMVPIETPKGTFNVWTKRIGNNPAARVLLLTGGPGASHEYVECFESFFPKEGIEFIYYDQMGTGYSDNPKDTSLFDLARCVDEVEQVRKALHLGKENLYVWGHSWGGILAMEYAIKYQQHMKALIISNMMASAEDYNRYADEVLAKQLDPKVLDTIRQIEKKGDYQNPRYMELLMAHFYSKFICRLPQWPEPMVRSMSRMNQPFYVTMQGPSEFGLSGKLLGWDVKAKLPTITVPTLVIGAKHDTMDPEHMKWIASQVKNGTYLFCPNGSHMSMYDDQQTYMKGLISFIRKTSGGVQQ
jgi:proline iminopeptidase